MATTQAKAKKRAVPKPALTIERFTLGNGMRVVLGPDRSAPTVGVCLNYDVGLRSEPEGRTGFAHLFEHLMFQGSVSLPKGEYDKLVEGNGGQLNGSTHSDYTNYISQVPANAFELLMWLEADRMRGLRLTEESLTNQIDVVKEEIRVNVLNRPYGGFPWIDLPPIMFKTFNNAHDGYGSFVDLEAATLDDAADFFDKYYAPGNAQLAITGDFDTSVAAKVIEREFGGIASRPVPPVPDCAEPAPSKERRGTKSDAMAPMPALAAGYRIPDPIGQFEDYLASVVLVEVLTDGEASRLYQRLVKQDRSCPYVGGLIGTFGDPFEMRDPTMLQILAYHPGGPAKAVLAAIDEEAARVADAGVGAEELARTKTNLISNHLRRLDNFLSRASTMATLEQQRDRADLVNEIPELIDAVDASAVAKAAELLRPSNRAVLEVVPGEAK